MPDTQHSGTPLSFDAASLHIVKPEIDVSLQQIEAALSSYVDDSDNTAGLPDAAEAMEQIHGILRLLQLPGTPALAGAMATLLKKVADTPDDIEESDLYALGEGLMVLSRYLEFALLRDTLLPHLLTPTINRLRRILKQPLLREGQLLEGAEALNSLPAPSQAKSSLPIEQHKPVLNFLSRLYKNALVAVLSGKPAQRDLLALQTATQQASALAGGTEGELYWQAAAAATADIAQCLPLTDSRKRVLIQIQQQLSRFGSPVSAADLQDVLGFACCRDSDTASTLRDSLGLGAILVSDRTTREQAPYLFGPDTLVMKTVSDLVHEEISSIKDQLDALARGDAVEGGWAGLAERFQTIGHTVGMLNQTEPATEVHQAASRLSQWTAVPDQDSLNTVMDALLIAENSVTLLEKSYTPGAVGLAFNNMRISTHQLDEARKTLISESRGTLGMAMRSLLSFVESSGDMLHMDNVPVMLESVGGAMEFLQAPRGRELLKRAASYVSGHFGPEAKAPGPSVIAGLADAMSCIDYYLEGLENSKPAGMKPFTVGEHSMDQLEAA